MNAEEARRIVSENKERQEAIQKEIKKGERKIEAEARVGRRHTTIFPGWCDNDGTPQYPEVVQHFKDLGYEVKWAYGTSLYEVRW